ncbi:MAG: hypothetical protein Q8K13_07955 [Parvibaculum sp.]|uniref:hypothetical protein n=1 Tax=Parvibaculum sp. TaxID=2024848 RepID=UPI002731C006|nr:hypothetical protein [Parvibaculum sp.]MDP2149557.1 hypothetical protein [Parvibaculum sp.]
MHVSRRRHWLAALLAFAVLLTGVAAPMTGLDMMMSAHMMADSGASSSAADAMAGMTGPCCDDCDRADTTSCDSSAFCMTACGKLPLQLAATSGFVPARHAIKAVREPAIGRADLSPAPLQRPPKAV